MSIAICCMSAMSAKGPCHSSSKESQIAKCLVVFTGAYSPSHRGFMSLLRTPKSKDGILVNQINLNHL